MSKNIRRVNPTEHEIQAAIVEWANNIEFKLALINSRKVGEFLIKIPNEGKRSFYVGKKFKKEGLRKGAFDLFLAIPVLMGIGSLSHGMFIEVKSKKGKLSNEQYFFQEAMINNGYRCAMVKTVDEGIQAIKEYLGMR